MMRRVTQEISPAALATFLIGTQTQKRVNLSTGPAHSKALTSASAQFLIGNENVSRKKLSPCKFNELQFSNREEFSLFRPPDASDAHSSLRRASEHFSTPMRSISMPLKSSRGVKPMQKNLRNLGAWF